MVAHGAHLPPLDGLDAALGLFGLGFRRGFLREHHGELSVGAGALKHHVRLLVVIVGHELLRLIDLLGGELEVERCLRLLLRAELPCATRGGFSARELVGQAAASCCRMRRERGCKPPGSFVSTSRGEHTKARRRGNIFQKGPHPERHAADVGLSRSPSEGRSCRATRRGAAYFCSMKRLPLSHPLACSPQ